MSRCRHGETDSHGEVGKDWCPGALPRGAEPWRSQLEFQMNGNTFRTLTIGDAGHGSEPVVIHPMHLDSLKNFRPIGYGIDGRFIMFEKPGEYVSLPDVPS